MPVFPCWQLVRSQVPWKWFSEGYRRGRRDLPNNTFVHPSITRFWFCSQCMWQLFIHTAYYDVSCPTPCSGTRKKRMHSLKIGREAKICPVLWVYLKKRKEGGRYKKVDHVNALCASISSSNQDAKRKLSADESVVMAPPPTGLWTMLVSSTWHKSPPPGARATLAQKSPFKSSSQSHLCLIAWVVQFLEIGQSLLLE